METLNLKKTIKMKTTHAHTYLEILVNCPYCGNKNQDVTELKENFTDGLSASGLNEEVKCEVCQQLFIVTDINF